jgi:hypothetical protein
LRDVVLPLASAKLRNMPLSPAAAGMSGVYAWLTNIAARNNGVYVGLEAFRPGPASEDTATPTTMLMKTPPHLVPAGMARFYVGGTDDTTPSELLRYQWQVDDGPLSTPSFERGISVPVTASGSHTFRVRAVDLYDKPDAGFQSYTFDLDPVAPTITVLDAPEVVVRDTSTTIRFSGMDDRTPPDQMTYTFRVEARPAGGDPVLTPAGKPQNLSNGVAEVHVDNLQENTTYQVTVMLYDAAGNVTSQQFGFGVASTNGCSMAPQANGTAAPFEMVAPFAAFAMLAALFFFFRRRAEDPR